MRHQEKIYSILVWIIFILVIFCYWRINDWLPKIMEDDFFTLSLCQELTDRSIRCYSDVFYSIIENYYSQHGRLIVHFLTQCFCALWGQQAFDIFNTFLFVAFLLILSKIVEPKQIAPAVRVGVMMTLGFLLFLLIPECSVFYNGIDYSFNYLWPATTCLAFCYIVFDESKLAKSYLWLNLLIAFIAGWSHEGFAIPIGFSLLILFLNKKFKVSSHLWALSICFGIGALICILSPANFGRMDSGAIGNRFSLFCNLRASLLLVCGLIYLFFKGKKQCILINLQFLLIWLGSLIFVLIINQNKPHTILIIEFYAFLALTKIFFPQIENIKLTSFVGSLAFLIGFLLIMPYQRMAALQYDTIRSKLYTISPQDNILFVQKIHIPWIYEGYVNYFSKSPERIGVEECSFGIVCGKKNLIICEHSGLEYNSNLCDLFISQYKLPGTNSFYQIGNRIYSEQPLPQKIYVNLLLDDYDLHKQEGLIKNLLSLKNRNNEMQIELKIDSINVDGALIYFAPWNEKPLRKIKEFNVLM